MEVGGERRYATSGYYAVRVTNAGTAGIVNATVTVAGVTSFLGSRLVAGGNYTAGVDVRVAVPGARIRLATCFGSRSVACRGPGAQVTPLTPRFGRPQDGRSGDGSVVDAA
jgi:hypothetical protein